MFIRITDGLVLRSTVGTNYHNKKAYVTVIKKY
jgi:hypothetical protein